MTIDYLKCRTQDLEIPDENPFQNDKLGRSQIADALTDVASFYGQSGCVMALDGEWGAGKTTFVKMWEKSLQKKGFKTLYFNAWSSDYSDDALMAIVSELQELSPESDTSKKLVEITGRILLTVGKIAAKCLIGSGGDAVEALLSEGTDIGKECLNAYVTQKNTIEDFKKHVSKFVAFNAGEHPIVFFVDELDRCSPRYAVSVLERIKHLFEIPNIIFVLAINKVQLCNAIQGYFGSANMDSNEYLRRFIDIEYTLPAPKLENYCEYLYNEYRFYDFFRSNQRMSSLSSYYDSEHFKTIAYTMCEIVQINLRQIDRIYAYARLALMQFHPSNYLLPDVYFLLCFWKIVNPTFYKSIRNKDYNTQELLSKLEEIIPDGYFNQAYSIYNNDYILYAIAGFIYCYDITDIKNQRIVNPSIKANQVDGKNSYNIKSRCFDNDKFYEALDNFYACNNRSFSYGLSYIFNRIDLLDSFK